MDQHAFKADCLPLFLGSLPEMNDDRAFDIVMKYSPLIPNWSQMPGKDKREGMVAQFAPGLPGLKKGETFLYVDNTSAAFEEEMLRFYETYLDPSSFQGGQENGLYSLSMDTAQGFFTFLNRLDRMGKQPRVIKGQITGPFTLGTALKDVSGRAIFHDATIRDMLVKLLAMKARWQVEQLVPKGYPVILLVDEPALAGFGTSEFISISRDVIIEALSEIFNAIQNAGAIAGVHVCANTDWSMLMATGVDLISFDAYTYFDRVVLYQDAITDFITAGKCLAWGIVPTLQAADIEKETVATLTQQFKDKLGRVLALGIDRELVLGQSLITPSCGTGTLSVELAEKVMQLTKGVSDTIRKEEKYA
jgi:methionine synthase II (cobalamin-independent)